MTYLISVFSVYTKLETLSRNPYTNAPSCHINLLELSRYAKKHGKKLVELTLDEIKKFSI